tara:strand:+ start:11915 stop:12418 length:504 start_codon:yes stop_codon:yes gene_type:complete
MPKKIALERLREIVDAYGASPERWPAGERQAAGALLAASAEARALLDEAASFDAFLDMAPLEAPSAALAERLMAARPRAVPPARARAAEPKPGGFIRGLVEAVWPYGSPAFPAAALAASLMLGVVFGSTVGTATGTTAVAASGEMRASDEFIALALADTEWPEEWIQ